MKEQMSGDQADREQLQRIVDKINAAMPHFKSVMGGESDHAELAVGQLIVERDTLREACRMAVCECDGGSVIRGGICNALRVALASLYDNTPSRDATRPPYHPHELGD
jgi:hypothetical protein